MTYALVAIGALALMALVGWVAYARSQKRYGASENENESLREGAEVMDEVNEILAEPVVSGGRLRTRLAARARRYGLLGSGDLARTSALPSDEPPGGS